MNSSALPSAFPSAFNNKGADHTIALLGIDPGLAETGWGVILIEENTGMESFCAAGNIRTSASEALSSRLQTIFTEISQVIALYKPSLVAMEEVFLNRNPESTMKLCHGRAAAMLAAAIANLEVKEYHNRQIKSAIVGKGNAQKEQMLTMIQFMLPNIDTDNEHAIDALCVAVCAQHHRHAEATIMQATKQRKR